VKLGLAVRQYVAHGRALGRAERTVEAYAKRLGYFNRFAAGRKVTRVREVSLALVRAYHRGMVRRGLGAGSRKTFLSTVRDFLGWAHARGLTLSDFSRRIELPRPGRRLPPSPLLEAEVDGLVDLVASETPVGLRNRAIIEMLYACGLRRQELLDLDVGSLDFDGELVLVRGKGGKDRMLPVNRRALEAVAAYIGSRGRRPRRAEPLFVTHPGSASTKRMTASDLAAVFRRINRHFERRVHPHLLRHTFAVHMLRGGADIRHVQLLLGHESPDTTSGYLGLVKDDLKRAYDAAMESILEDGGLDGDEE
jgi:site-specific recombinase XerD